MEILTKADLEQLMRKEEQQCVSIYMPTHRTGVETQQDPIRLKNLLAKAEKSLSEQGLGPRDVQKIFEPASTLLMNSEFWQHQSDGLAIFLSANSASIYRLPLSFEDLVMVDDHFYIKPLLPLITGDGQFFILALSQNEIRLLNATRYGVSEVDTGQLVGSLDEATQPDDHQRSLQAHSSGPAGASNGGSSATFHGQGGGSDESAKKDLLRYFHLVEDSLAEFLQGDQVPLILAGVEYILPIYKEANTYPNMIDMVIKGNPDFLSMEELHKSAWEIIRPHFQIPQEKAIAFYQQLSGQKSRRAANTLEKILPAAIQGRIETLFIAAGIQQWGVINPISNGIEIHDQMQPGDEHLLDLAAVQTYLKGGTVYVVEPENVPDATYAAAVLRY